MHALLIFAKHLIVIHVGIMYKLQIYNVNGLFFYRIIKYMYTNDRLCVRVDDKMTEFFMSEVRVRKGAALSPSLLKYS